MSTQRLWGLAVLVIIVVAGGLVWLVSGGQPLSLTAEGEESSPRQGSDLSGYQVERVSSEFTDEKCESEDSDRCANVSVKSLKYKGKSSLNRRIRQRLLTMGEPISDEQDGEAAGSDYRDYARFFFDQYHKVAEDMPSGLAYSADLGAEEVARHDGLLVLRLDSYLFTGGAHGMPTTQYMVIEAGKDRVLSLEDMLKPGKREAFDKALQRAYAEWSEEEDLDGEFWSFTRNDNVAPLEEAMAVTYQAYDIAPYAMGQPTLEIPYDQLEGILKSRYSPASGDQARD